MKLWIEITLLWTFAVPCLFGLDEDTTQLTRRLGYPYYTGEIIPKPKQAKFEDTFLSLADIASGKIESCILLGKTPALQERLAAERLQSRLKKAFADKTHLVVIANGEDEIPNECATVISIGTPSTNKLNAKLCERTGVNASQHGPESYVLFNTLEAGRDVVVCCGNDAIGSYYAAQSFNQLIAARDGKLMVRKARVIDWPSCTWRPAGGSNTTVSLDGFAWMSAYKVNTYFQDSNGVKYWFDLLHKGTLDMCNYAAKSGLFRNYHVMINPYATYFNPSDPANHKIKVSDTSDIQALIACYRKFLDAGANSITLNCDDYVWTDNNDFVLFYPEDKARFKDVADSHIYMANTVYATLAKEHPGLKMFFVPCYYAECHVTKWARDPELGRNYLKKIGHGLLPQIKIGLCGPEVWQLPLITREDVNRMSELLGGREWYLWDNTPSLYYTDRGGAQKPNGIFRPYTSQFPNDFIRTHLYAFNSAIDNIAIQERSRITHISVIDYAWNQEAYDPEWSLRQSIDSYVGPEMSSLLIRFGDLYAAVEKSISAEVTDSPAGQKTCKFILEENFEAASLPASILGRHSSSEMNAHLEKLDMLGGGQCSVSESRRKGCSLRSDDRIFVLSTTDLRKYEVDFYWKSSDSKVPLRVYLTANGGKDSLGKDIYLKKDLTAPNVEWNHYRIPLTGFEIVESPEMPITEITGLRFYQNGDAAQPIVFKIARVRLAESNNQESQKAKESRDAIENFKACFKEIEGRCWNGKLLADLKKNVFEPKMQSLERFSRKPILHVMSFDAGPTLDGKLDDGCWKSAEKTAPFKMFNDDSKTMMTTQAMAAYDDDSFYVAFMCKADAWDDDTRLITGKNGLAGINDSVEIFIEPNIGSGRYFHLIANRAGGTLTQKKGPILQNNASAWAPAWDVKTMKGEDGWTVEMRIPFDSLGKRPKRGETWGLNLCRNYVPGNECGAWSCTYGGFHTPLFFGKVTFE